MTNSGLSFVECKFCLSNFIPLSGVFKHRKGCITMKKVIKEIGIMGLISMFLFSFWYIFLTERILPIEFMVGVEQIIWTTDIGISKIYHWYDQIKHLPILIVIIIPIIYKVWKDKKGIYTIPFTLGIVFGTIIPWVNYSMLTWMTTAGNTWMSNIHLAMCTVSPTILMGVILSGVYGYRNYRNLKNNNAILFFTFGIVSSSSITLFYGIMWGMAYLFFSVLLMRLTSRILSYISRTIKKLQAD
jgi:hypothetical protein